MNPKDPDISSQDEHVLALLDNLGPDSVPADEDSLEALAQLPYALEEVTPSPEVKRALMRSVSEPSVESPLPFASADPESTRLAQLEQRSRWYMPIAAALAVALIGLAGWQFKQLEGQRQIISNLSSQIENLERDGEALLAARGQLSEMQSQLRMLTTRGAEFCVLKPFGDEPSHPGATATMVVSSDRSSWYLAAEGLEPCTEGRSYQLWFITDGDPIRAATFDGATAGGRVELTGTHYGPLEGVRAVTVTLEAEPEPATPSTAILFADQAMTLL